ncbi:MAG: GNAT family N-acetyltransferase [Ruminococcus sp.]|nr:GNAT family N-acetyltransferase [Ruminococcus sp.]
MAIEYRQAAAEDAELLINIYNASFYEDHLRYGSCPGYGKTKEMMEESISSYPKYIILCDSRPVGCISCRRLQKGVYEIGSLCVVPEYQGKGIGTQAVGFIKALNADWERITLVTPADKKENVKFYTEKCGFHIGPTEKDGNVELARLVLERQIPVCPNR